MPKYLTESGKITTADDPKRMVWYGLCTYWTDDWEKVKTSGIPSCPHCRAYGYQCTAEDWEKSARMFEEEDNYPRYTEFLAQFKEKCEPKKKILDLYKEWLAEQ